MTAAPFAERLLAWFRLAGRHDLPWQQPGNAYAVWVSEIMLQQTQVTTVIPYYLRFMQHFPDVAVLAAAPLDAVLAHWSGLGYYARARNLHRAAGQIVTHHGGAVPRDFEALTALPGIGRSTAGAILALSFDDYHVILDGNVKRVLTRHCGIREWPGSTAVSSQLWAIATERTPASQVAAYTQAIMDLGATLCTRSKPGCGDCPVGEDCIAARDGLQAEIPGRKPRRARPVRATRMLLLRDATGAILLERRPPEGIWGGLYCLPEVPAEAVPGEWAADRFGIPMAEAVALEEVRHVFTHFELMIRPLLVELGERGGVMDQAAGVWYKPGQPGEIGLPAPVARILGQHASHSEGDSGS